MYQKFYKSRDQAINILKDNIKIEKKKIYETDISNCVFC